jgi:GDPmannose 4,6-dehydratase
MPTALVTGPTGQDGSYLVERLLTTGWKVHGLVRAADRTRAMPREITWHEGDLRGADDLRRVVHDVAPDRLYNLAGISSVAQSWREPELTTAVNAAAVTTLLEAAWRLQEDRGRQVRFLQASSAEIFGTADQVPQTEITPLRPVNPYGATKAFAHHMVSVYRGRGLHASNCILYNHESPRRPESFVTRKITATAARIARGEQEELVLGSLDVRRDWGWAPDFVEAMLLAAGHDQAGDYVIATGRDHSVRDFVTAAFARAGVQDWEHRVRTDPGLARPADAPVLVGDASRAQRILGWLPTMTFEEIVAAMVDADLKR